jgi:hypothetical protein
MNSRNIAIRLVGIILALALIFGSARVSPVTAQTSLPQMYADDQEDKGFWEKLFEDFSVSNLLDLIFDFIDEQDQKMDDYFINSRFSTEQKEQIAQYSGGKSPAELSAQFCSDSTTSDAQMMFEDIRRSYAGTENDPKSPIHLIELFEKMSSVCE